MRTEALAAIAAMSVACLPSIDLALPRPEQSASIVLVPSDGSPVPMNYDEPIRFAFADDTLHAVTLSQTLEALQIPRTWPVGGTRSLVTETATAWRGDIVGDRYEWFIDEGFSTELLVAPFDGRACIETPGACVRTNHAGERSCASPCEVSPSIARPAPPNSARTSVALVDPEACGPGEAQFDPDRCTPVTTCPSGDALPPDLPVGVLYELPVGANVTREIIDRPEVDVFVLASEQRDFDITANRPVHIWGRCPLNTVVGEVRLRAGGSIGRLTADQVDVAATATISMVVTGAFRAESANVTVRRALVTGGRFLALTSTGRVDELVLVDEATFHVRSSTVTLSRLVGLSGSTFVFSRGADVVVDGLWVTNADRELHAVVVSDSRLDARRVAIRGADSGVKSTDSDVAVRDVRIDEARSGLFIDGGSVVVEDYSGTQFEVASIFVTASANVSEAKVTADRIAISGGRSALRVRGDRPGAVDVEMRDVTVSMMAFGVEGDQNTSITLTRGDFAELRTAIEVGAGGRVRLEDVVIRSVEIGFAASASGRIDAKRIAFVGINEGLVLGALVPDVSGGGIELVDLYASQTGGFVAAAGAKVVLETFDLDGGPRIGIGVQDDGELVARNGRVTGYDTGLLLESEAEDLFSRVLLDGVIIDGNTDDIAVQ